ncbi:MAG: His-Xaa-Ser system radical SAM maturase HxsC [Albidovulum sp.]|nr:His-Xaa-Ser system radical SAM maturase HxsC [Albidovulum sp.]
MLPLYTRARVRGVREKSIVKVLAANEALRTDIDTRRCLLWLEQNKNVESERLGDSWAGILTNGEIENGNAARIVVDCIETPSVIAPGDVIRLLEGSSRVSVLFRRGSNSNTLLATERCNSFCVMCSQPPRDVDDRWLVDEMLETIPLVDREEVQLGVSGGEPTLLGDDLVVVLHQARRFLPDTGLHILSNGRRFADEAFARTVCAVRHPNLTWGIPVFSDCPEIHDYIVQVRSAWDETLIGLFNLAKFGGNIEIRVVVQRPNVERLGELAYFIFRNLTFSKHVAFMGLEPIGFAKKNYEQLWIDPVDCMKALKDAVYFLANRGMTVSLYNFPLCTVPKELRLYCRQSISDWKNTYLAECNSCDQRGKCCGFFRTINSKSLT